MRTALPALPALWILVPGAAHAGRGEPIDLCCVEDVCDAALSEKDCLVKRGTFVTCDADKGTCTATDGSRDLRFMLDDAVALGDAVLQSYPDGVPTSHPGFDPWTDWDFADPCGSIYNPNDPSPQECEVVGGGGGVDPGHHGEPDCTLCSLEFVGCNLAKPGLIGFIICSARLMDCTKKYCDDE